MNPKLKAGLSIAIVIICLLIPIFIGIFYGQTITNQNKSAEAFLKHIEITHKFIQTEHNKRINLNKLILDKNKENEDLLQVIKSLNERPSNVKYIVRTETVLEPSDPIFITSQLPDSYLHQLDNDITVASFTHLGEEFKFETYSLALKTDMAITDKKTSSLTQIKSSYDDVWREIPMELNVSTPKEKNKFFKTEVGLGVSVDSNLDVYPSLILSSLHYGDFDFVNIRGGYNKDFKLGIDPISYNIGKPLPVLDDLWLSGGGSLTSDLNKTLDISLSTKF